jgi:hypothetical protein
VGNVEDQRLMLTESGFEKSFPTDSEIYEGIDSTLNQLVGTHPSSSKARKNPLVFS